MLSTAIKSCRVIVNCFLDGRSSRNNSPCTKEECLDLLKKVIDTEINNVKSNLYDIIIINHQTGYSEGDEYLDSINNKNIPNGKIIVVHTPNLGLSFDGYNTAFLKFKDDYEYWIFSEDDHILFADSYYKILIDEFESLKDENIGFLAFAPISNYIITHSGGGFGLTKRDILLKLINNQNGNLSCLANRGSRTAAEIYFTNDFITNGYKIIENKTYSLSPINLEKCEDHKINFRNNGERPFLFKVGL